MLIPKKTYEKMVAALPILCVDLIVVWRSMHLLVLRKNEPLKGEWWVPGGRVRRGERTDEAAERLLAGEVGFKPPLGTEMTLAGIYEGFFKKSAANMKKGIHTVSVVYRMRIPNTSEIAVRVDKQSSDYTWADELPPGFINNLKTL